MRNSIHLVVLFVLLFVGCGRIESTGDAAMLIASGGILPIKKTTLCDFGILVCDTEESDVMDANDSLSDTNNTNLPPRLQFYVQGVDMKVGDERNLQLQIVDPEDDNLTDVYYFVDDPTLAVLEIVDRPYSLKITAKKEGNANIKVLAKDYYFNEGSSEAIPLSILEVNPRAPEVKLTTNLLEMDVSTSQTIEYIYAGLRPKYEVSSRTNNRLVTVTPNTATKTIIITAGNTAGTDQITLTFTDSRNLPVEETVVVLVKGLINTEGGGDVPDDVPDPNPKPPPTTTTGGERETDTAVFNDTSACLNAFPWKSLTHHYSNVKDRTVSSKNSISITSLTADAAVTLYYQEKADKALETPYGYDVTAPNDPANTGQSLGLPLKDGTRDRTRLFILQFPEEFLGAGKFYLRIKDDCYRGKFPATGAPNDLQQAKYDVKIVINEE